MHYKAELKDELIRLFNEFFNEERGNRITTNNMEGFTLKVQDLLSKMEIRESGDDNKRAKG